MIAGAAAVAAACGAPPEIRRAEALLDTIVEIRAPAGAEEAVEAAFEAIRAVDAAANPYDESSPLARRNRGEEAPSSVLDDILLHAEMSRRATGGAFDERLFDITRLWGFGTDSPRVPADSEIRAALAEVAAGRGAADLGGIAKGYAVDTAAAALQRAGVERFLIDAGGNIRAAAGPGGAPWRIGIRHPRRPGALVTVIEVSDGGISTSGDYIRFFERDGVRYHHILDPRTGRPARGAVSVTVRSSTATMADVLSTAVFVMGGETGVAFLEAAGDDGIVFLDDSGSWIATRGWADLEVEW